MNEFINFFRGDIGYFINYHIEQHEVITILQKYTDNGIISTIHFSYLHRMSIEGL